MLLFILFAVFAPVLAAGAAARVLRDRSGFSLRNVLFSYATAHAFAYLWQLFVYTGSNHEQLLLFERLTLLFDETHSARIFGEWWHALLLGNIVAVLLLCLFRCRPNFARPGKRFIPVFILFFMVPFWETAMHWTFATFPLDPVLVFAVLGAPLKGSVGGFVKLFLVQALLPVLLLVLLSLPAVLALYNLGQVRKVKTRTLELLCSAALICVTVVQLLCGVPLLGFYSEYKKVTAIPVDSEFYREHYKAPASVKISAPEQKRNVMLVFLESMEASFTDTATGGIFAENYIPEISKIALDPRHVHFSKDGKLGGGTDVDGTGWTMGAIVAKTLGVPLHVYNLKEPSVKGPSFLPRAVGLFEILKGFGYNEFFMEGAPGAFSSKDLFFQDHGGLRIHDVNYYEEAGKLPKGYYVFWGYEDAKLFEFAKAELDSLSKLPEPFFFSMLTVDAHYPNGWFDEATCPEFKPETNDLNETYKAVLRCTSKQFGAFFEWLERQPWFENTTVVLVGDHLFMGQVFIPEDFKVQAKRDSTRHWLDVFVNSAVEPPTRTRRFTSFDILPSVLEAAGFEIEGHALGLGRSLFSSESTLLEKLGLDSLNSELRKKTEQYEFLMGK